MKNYNEYYTNYNYYGYMTITDKKAQYSNKIQDAYKEYKENERGE